MFITFEFYKDRKELSKFWKEYNRGEVKLSRIVKGVFWGILISIIVFLVLVICAFLLLAGLLFVFLIEELFGWELIRF